jgi:hypothetical protein
MSDTLIMLLIIGGGVLLAIAAIIRRTWRNSGSAWPDPRAHAGPSPSTTYATSMHAVDNNIAAINASIDSSGHHG